jgi:glycosyltransferase involved in cell wall biosynthesis
MAEPLVSVVIPLYNAGEWIGETIRSVQSQTVEPGTLDVILVDNGSTDRGVEIARQTLRESPVAFRIVENGANRGPSFARNAGWLGSRAPWIQFLDSDDLLTPDKIESQLSAALSAEPDVAAVYSEWQSWEHDGRDWKPMPPLRAPQIGADPVLNLLEDRNFVHTGSQLFRSSWLQKVNGFDERWWLIEDVDLNMRLSMAGGRFVSAPAGRALFYYRRRGSSLSRRRLDFLAGCVRNLRLAESHWRENGLLTPERAGFLLQSYESLLHNLASVDDGAFEDLLRHVRDLSPGWLPRQPGMQLLSRVVGYRRAERVSMRYRELKAFSRRARSL